MDRAAFAQKLSDALDKDLITPNGSTLLEALDWDSLSAITFIALASELLNKNIESSQLQSSKTLDDLFDTCFK